MNDIEILEDFIEGKIEPDKLENYKGGYKMGFFYTKDLQKAIKNLIQRNKDLKQIEKEHKEENGRLRDRINKTINKLNEDISDDNCMWVNNQEKIVTATKTIIDRSDYAKEILELLEESEK